MLRAFIDSCPGIYFVTSVEGIVAHTNREAARLFGEEGLSLLERVHPADHDAFVAVWERLPEDGEARSGVSRLRGADELYKAFSWSARRVKEGPEIHVVLLPAAPADPIREQLLKVILDNVEIGVAVMDRHGMCSINEGKSLTTAGLGKNFNVGKNMLEMYKHDALITENFEGALRGEERHYVVEAYGILWENWASPIKDEDGETTGAITVSIDKSESKRAMQEMQHKLDLIERQQEVIRNLETPIIEVWERVVTLPMMGIVDSARAARVMDDLLASVSRLGARFAILDLTGVDTVDTATAAHLLGLISAIRLLGAEGIITGIRPTVAQTIVSLGLDLTRVTTCSNLREALKLCIRRMNAVASASA